ncbi:diaminopimelate epimerase [Thiomonas sp. X19]|uniref:diaminopimelate epimerase n=1 Tax=Thiomonas sp. X19 TaxID=1050370 RepID=UPI000B75B2A9|nr:diaminopimelate epimerase [Thiomonas sp. X19]SCC95535.1 diaminopimelate epimerase [Thiomonas sp. X19]
MKLQFTKMHGAGNDFIMLDATREALALSPAQLRLLADRHFGVGADQILMVEPAPSADIDFRYRIFNADGGEVEQCGNGARCFVAFVRRRGLTDKRSIRVLTRSGIIQPRLEDDGRVTVDMGPPRFTPAEIPFDNAGLAPRLEAGFERWPLELGAADASAAATSSTTIWISALSMGNPHAVQRVDEVDTAPVTTLGPRIEHHRRFPRRVNAGFMQVMNPHHICLRVWERGAGETLACGTGACAAVVAGMRHGWLQSPVEVDIHGGRLTIAWDGAGSPVYMTGPVAHVFDGNIEL